MLIAAVLARPGAPARSSFCSGPRLCGAETCPQRCRSSQACSSERIKTPVQWLQTRREPRLVHVGDAQPCRWHLVCLSQLPLRLHVWLLMRILRLTGHNDAGTANNGDSSIDKHPEMTRLPSGVDTVQTCLLAVMLGGKRELFLYEKPPPGLLVEHIPGAQS